MHKTHSLDVHEARTQAEGRIYSDGNRKIAQLGGPFLKCMNNKKIISHRGDNNVHTRAHTFIIIVTTTTS